MKNISIIVALLFVLVTPSFSAPFFYWAIIDSKEKDLKRLNNFKFYTAYKSEDDTWTCEIAQPKGFREEGSDVFQEGLDITCTLKSNTRITVRNYGACTKHSNSSTANSSASINVTTKIGTRHEIRAVCSEKKWTE